MRLKRKPDLLAVLTVLVTLGVIATSLAQGLTQGDDNAHLANAPTPPSHTRFSN